MNRVKTQLVRSSHWHLVLGLCSAFIFGMGSAHAAPAKAKKAGFASYGFRTLPTPSKEDEETLYKLVRKADSFSDKKGAAKAKALLKKLTPKDLPAMFRVLARTSSAKKFFYPKFVSFGAKGLLAVDVLLAKKAPEAKYHGFSRRDKYLKSIGQVCAKFGKLAVPALKASLVSSNRFQRRAGAWGIALMKKAGHPIVREALASPRAMERLGALYIVDNYKEKEVTLFAKELLQSLQTAPSLKDLSYNKYPMQRMFASILPKAGPSIPGKMVDILSSPKANSMEKFVAPKVLKKLGPKAKSVVTKILPMLDSKVHETQVLGITLLTAMKMKLPKAYKPLRRFVAGAAEPIRSQAAQALLVCGDTDKATVVSVAKGLENALKTLAAKKGRAYSEQKIVSTYLESLQLLKKNALPAKNTVVSVISHPKATSSHVGKAVAVLQPFAKQVPEAAQAVAAAMKRLKFYSYQRSRLTKFILSTGEAGFKIAAPGIKKSLKTARSYGFSNILDNLKKVGKPASVLIGDVLARGANIKRGRFRKEAAETVAWMALAQPKLFAKLVSTKKAKEREILLMAFAKETKLLKAHSKAVKQLLKQATKEFTKYDSDTMSNVMDLLNKQPGELLVPLKESVQFFLKKGSFMIRLHAKYVLKKIVKTEKASKKK